MNALREGSPVVRIWWLFVLRGVLAGVLGITALLWPTLTIKILVLFVGAYLIADGVMGLVVASRRAAAPGRWVQPAVSASIGLLLVFWPGESATTLFVVLGAAALFLGISQVITARRFGIDTMDRRLMTTAGAAAAILGVILVVWPGVAVVTLSWIIAACALLVAAVLIFLGVRIKQARVVVEQMPPRGPTG